MRKVIFQPVIFQWPILMGILFDPKPPFGAELTTGGLVAMKWKTGHSKMKFLLFRGYSIFHWTMIMGERFLGVLREYDTSPNRWRWPVDVFQIG